MVNINLNPARLVVPRLATLGTITTFSVIVLGLSAHWISVTEKDFDPPFYDPYAALALAVALLTILTVPALLVVDLVRKGAIVNKIFVEMSWLGTLAILWLASAGTTARAYNNSWLVCVYNFDIVIQGCKETRAIQAFSHLIWISLLFYLSSLFAFALISRNNGVEVWQSSVRDAKFAVNSAPSAQHAGYNSDPKLAQMQTQVPVLQQAYPPQGQPGYVTPQQSEYGQGSPYTAPAQQV